MKKERLCTRDVILLLIASFFYMSSLMLASPIVAGYAGSLGAGAALMGFVSSLLGMCAFFTRPFAGNLSDRLSKRRLSIIGATLIGVTSFAYVLVRTPLLLVLARVINGAGYAFVSICMSTWMANLLPPDRVGSGMGIFGTVQALASAIAPAVGVRIYEKIGYHPAFYLATFCAALTVTFVLLMHDHGEPTPIPTAPGEKRGLRIVDKNVLPVGLIVLLFTMPYTATQSFLVTYVETRALDVPVSLFFPVYAAVLLVLRFGCKELFDRVKFSRFVIISSISALCSFTALWLMRGTVGMFLGAFLMAGGYGIMCTVCQSRAIMLAGPGRRGLANSTYYVGMDIGMTVGPLLGGVIYGNLPISAFYPCFYITVPLILLTLLWETRTSGRLGRG